MSANPDCPACGGCGWTADRSDPYNVKMVPCRCLTQAAATARLTALAGQYGRQTFATFNAAMPGVQEAHRLATAYAAQPTPTGWLLLAGPVGCGKTHLALAIAAAMMARGIAATFITAPDLLDGLRAEIARSKASREAGKWDGDGLDTVDLTRYQTAPLLVLDDLGTEKPSDFTREKLFSLLNWRYQRQLATVVTTNLDLASKEARDQLGARLCSRLGDQVLIERVTIAAADYRSLGAAQRSGRAA